MTYIQQKSRLSSNILAIIALIGVLSVLVGCGAQAATAPVSEQLRPDSQAQTAVESAQVSQTRPDYAGKKILFVDSYHKGYEWSDGIEAGIQAILNDTQVELKIVRMDTKRNQGDEFGSNAALQVKAEIEAFAPDVVIASDDNAQKYLVVPYLKDTSLPVVFAGVNWDASIYGYPASNVTGMVEVELPAQLVDHLKSYARGDRLGYLTVDSETERKVANIYNDWFFDGAMKVYQVSTLDEFKEMFLKTQNEVDILFIGNNAGLDQWEHDEIEKFITANTKIPTGTINPWLAPYALITLAKRPQEQGEWSAQTALHILDGTPVSEIPLVENKDGELILNLEIAKQLDVVFTPSMLRNAEIYNHKSANQ